MGEQGPARIARVSRSRQGQAGENQAGRVPMRLLGCRCRISTVVHRAHTRYTARTHTRGVNPLPSVHYQHTHTHTYTQNTIQHTTHKTTHTHTCRARGRAHALSLTCGTSKLMTTSTDGMSRPREATSVATRMLRSPLLNLLSAPRRLGWLMWPWMGTAPKPRLRSSSAMRRVDSQVRVKI